MKHMFCILPNLSKFFCLICMSVILLVALVPSAGAISNTQEDLTTEKSPDHMSFKSPPEKESSAEFVCDFENVNGYKIATINVYVEGVFSQIDNWSTITDLDFDTSIQNGELYTLETRKNGDSAHILVFWSKPNADGTRPLYADYVFRIRPNGLISYFGVTCYRD